MRINAEGAFDLLRRAIQPAAVNSGIALEDREMVTAAILAAFGASRAFRHIILAAGAMPAQRNVEGTSFLKTTCHSTTFPGTERF